jgi:hypothetical protein
MESKKTSKKSAKTTDIAAAPVMLTEAPKKVSKPVKRAASAGKAAAKVSAKSSSPKNSSHRHSKPSAAAPAPINYDEVARLAYKYWEDRNHADGFAEEDWHRAEKAIRAQH